MNWFGFGFNGFGQIGPADVTCKVSTPVLISDVCRSCVIRSDCRVRASWSSRAHVHHTDSGSHVCVSGFGSGSSGQVCGDSFPESRGCTDALISERHLMLNFTDRVECWEIQQPQNKLVWKSEQDLSVNTGQAAPLPLVPGGYVMPRSPFFRALCSDLCAVSLALGPEHAVLLTAVGTVYSWGSGSHGQLGHGALTSQDEPQVLEALWGVPIRAVSAGSWHSASVSTGGDLYMWGWNESGQLGLPSRGLEEEKHRAKSGGHTDQTISKDEKEQADMFISIQAFPALVDVPNVSEISRVSCGSRHTAAITGHITASSQSINALGICTPGDGVIMDSWDIAVKIAQMSRRWWIISLLTACVFRMLSVGYGARLCPLCQKNNIHPDRNGPRVP